MKLRSLTRQTAGIVLVSQLLCTLVLSGLALLHERHTRLRALDERLQGRADSVLGAIQDAEDPADNVIIDPNELRPSSGDLYAVYSPGGKLIGHSGQGVLLTPSHNGFRNASYSGIRYRIFQNPALRIIDRDDNDGTGIKRPVLILYAIPEEHMAHEIFEAASFYILVLSIAGALTFILVFLLLKRALEPLLELEATAARLTPATLEFIPPPSAMRVRELRPLADVLSGVMESLRRAFQKEQRFVGDAAHELKTAIAVVRSTVQVLMLRPRTQQEYSLGLERILQDSERLERLVAHMLQLSRVEGENLTGSQVDLGESVQTTLGRLLPVAEAAGVQLRSEVQAGTTVLLSAERADLLVSNLVMNAIQHSSIGMTVEIDVVKTEQSVVLRVADTGHGIQASALPHVFERFYREDVSRSRQTGGVGLGLSICKAIVDTAGGTIIMKSKPEEGTEVRVLLKRT